jgi:hypothetical protein
MDNQIREEREIERERGGEREEKKEEIQVLYGPVDVCK